MTTAAIARPAIARPAYITRQEQEAKRALQLFLQTEEGERLFRQGGYSVRSKRVLIQGHGVGTKGVVAPCPHKTGTLQARAWNAGVDSRLNDFDL